VGKPQVAYRETIRQTAEYDYTHKKQTGGSGQYARDEAAGGAESRRRASSSKTKIKGGNIPKEFIPAIEKGVIEALEGGILAGYAMVDVKVTVFDGAYHEVDSSEMAFKICGSICVKEACRRRSRCCWSR
jgi:elongation factor G